MNSVNNPENFDLDMAKRIRNEIFTGQKLPVSYIFLCGGAGRTCIRNKVKQRLCCSDAEVLYPEDLFMDLMSREKSGDLLTALFNAPATMSSYYTADFQHSYYGGGQ